MTNAHEEALEELDKENVFEGLTPGPKTETPPVPLTMSFTYKSTSNDQARIKSVGRSLIQGI